MPSQKSASFGLGFVHARVYVGRVNVTPSPDPNAGYSNGRAGQPGAVAPCEIELTDDGSWFLGFGLFTIGWFAFWALETRNYIIADTVGCW